VTLSVLASASSCLAQEYRYRGDQGPGGRPQGFGQNKDEALQRSGTRGFGQEPPVDYSDHKVDDQMAGRDPRLASMGR